MGSLRSTPSAHGRRGFAVATVVVLLLLLNFLAFGSLKAGSVDAAVGALRVETLRALYACDAGVIVAMNELSGDGEWGGDRTLLLPHATVSLSGGGGSEEGFDLVIDGRSGYGRRRVAVRVDISE